MTHGSSATNPARPSTSGRRPRTRSRHRRAVARSSASPLRLSVRSHRPRVAGGLALGFAVGWNIANTGAVAGPLHDAYGVPLAAVGLLTTALFVTHFASQIPGGRLVDQVGARRAGLGAIGAIIAGNGVALVAMSFPLALAARLVIGLGTGVGFVAGSDYVRSASASPTAQGLYGGSTVGGGGAALAIVPLLAGWRAPYASAAVIAAVLGGVLAAASADERRERREAATVAAPVVRERRLYPLAALHTCSFAVSVIAGNWVVDLLDDHGHSRRLAGAVGALILLLGLLTRPRGGWVVRSSASGGRAALAASIVAGASGLAVLAAPAPLPLLVAGSALAGLAAGIPFAAAFSSAQRLRPDAPAAAVGFVNAVATLVIVVGTPLIGLTFSLPGDGRIGFALLAALSLTALPAVRYIAAGLLVRQ
jgi:MFS family permease